MYLKSLCTTIKEKNNRLSSEAITKLHVMVIHTMEFFASSPVPMVSAIRPEPGAVGLENGQFLLHDQSLAEGQRKHG
jgi:hypothetical protein